jgi:general secretion pathway protein K
MAKVNFQDRQCGAALLTVLLMVTVMSALAVAVIDDIRFAIRRTGNANLYAQAQWYVMGAEDFAQQIVAQTPPDALTQALTDPTGKKTSASFDIDGGWIKARVEDGANCFNLNSVVEGAGENGYRLRPDGVRQFANLLKALDFSDADREELASALVDWIDSDTRPQPRGAEDYEYSALAIPYRTGNTLLADVSELRAIKGFGADVVKALRPYVCAKPDTEKMVLNVNSLRQEQAVLLSALVGEALKPYAAEQLIAQRPGDGFPSTQTFWALKAFDGLDIGEKVKQQVSLESSYYVLKADVSFHEAYLEIRSLFKRNGKDFTLISRKIGSAV